MFEIIEEGVLSMTTSLEFFLITTNKAPSIFQTMTYANENHFMYETGISKIRKSEINQKTLTHGGSTNSEVFIHISLKINELFSKHQRRNNNSFLRLIQLRFWDKFNSNGTKYARIQSTH